MRVSESQLVYMLNSTLGRVTDDEGVVVAIVNTVLLLDSDLSGLVLGSVHLREVGQLAMVNSLFQYDPLGKRKSFFFIEKMRC
jgi:hypothetical protein